MNSNVVLGLQILGALPLLAYPAVLIANIMQAAALLDRSQVKSGSFLKRFFMGAFVLGTTAYPLLLGFCVVMARRAQGSGDADAALAWSAAPLAFLVVCVLYVVIASKTETYD